MEKLHDLYIFTSNAFQRGDISIFQIELENICKLNEFLDFILHTNDKRVSVDEWNILKT